MRRRHFSPSFRLPQTSTDRLNSEQFRLLRQHSTFPPDRQPIPRSFDLAIHRRRARAGVATTPRSRVFAVEANRLPTFPRLSERAYAHLHEPLSRCSRASLPQNFSEPSSALSESPESRARTRVDALARPGSKPLRTPIWSFGFPPSRSHAIAARTEPTRECEARKKPSRSNGLNARLRNFYLTGVQRTRRPVSRAGTPDPRFWKRFAAQNRATFRAVSPSRPAGLTASHSLRLGRLGISVRRVCG